MNTWESLRDGASSSRVKRERWFIRRGSRGGRSSRVIIIRQPIKIAARVLAFNINFKLITCIFVSRSWPGREKSVATCAYVPHSRLGNNSPREREKERESALADRSVCVSQPLDGRTPISNLWRIIPFTPSILIIAFEKLVSRSLLNFFVFYRNLIIVTRYR